MPTWRKIEKTFPEGVVIASDYKQEWLLPWWWDNYNKYNSFPVTFVNFGLSEKGKQFCKEKGKLVEIPPFPFLGARQNADPEKAKFWDSIYGGNLWEDKRTLWHKKPIALLQTPYERTLWLDTDCEVRCKLDPLFQKIAKNSSLLLCPAPEEIQKYAEKTKTVLQGERLFNSGVIGYRRGSDYIRIWADQTLKNHDIYFGDDNLLSRLIYKNNWPVQLLDRLYNKQELTEGYCMDTKISHWVGESGKFFISMKKLNFL